MNIINSFICLLFTCFFILPGCNPTSVWDEECKVLLQEAEQLESNHTKLNVSIDSLWDATSKALSMAIPEDFPPTDREIFLNSRNADHMRMFMSFKELSAETQSMVDEAGKYDTKLANEIRALQIQKADFEKRKTQFLRKVDEQSKEAYQQYAEQFRQASAGQSN